MQKYRKSAMILSVIGLVVILIGVTYSFFNYTRTGTANNLGTGTISFNANYGLSLNLTNVFPMTSEEVGNATLDTVTVGITGDTTYSEGEEFLVSIVDVTNTVNGKQIPINYIATYEATTGNTIGTSTDNYFEAEKNANIYKLNSTGRVIEDKQILVGYIKGGTDGINGTLSISAYIDADRIAISDTYYENAVATPTPTAPNDQYGTTTEWVDGRVVFTTSEWNSLSNNPISFKIRTESNEGLWVEEPEPDNVTPASCFETRLIKVYSINTNMSQTEFTACVDHFSANTFDNNGTAEEFCQGTATLYGLTFEQRILANYFYDYELNELANSNVLIPKLGLEIVDYNNNCGTDVIIPNKISSVRKIVNPNMSNSNVSDCVNYFSNYYSEYTLYEGETYEAYCRGTGTILGDLLQDNIDNNYYDSSMLEDIQNTNAIIDDIPRNYSVLSVDNINVLHHNTLSSIRYNQSLIKIVNSDIFYDDYYENVPNNIIIPSSVKYIHESSFAVFGSPAGNIIPNTTFTILGNPIIGEVSIPAYETIEYGGTCQELKTISNRLVWSNNYNKGISFYVKTSDNDACEIINGYNS